LLIDCVSPFKVRETKSEIKDKVVVIFDVLRATTTITAALYKGFEYVIPVTDVREGLTLAKKLKAVTAGEIDGEKIEQYDFSNSPNQILKIDKPKKYLVLRTTNGTRAIKHFSDQNIILAGAVVNAQAVAQAAIKIAEKEKKNICLVAVGRKGKPSPEDEYALGLVLNYMMNPDTAIHEKCLPHIEFANTTEPLDALLMSEWAKRMVKEKKEAEVRDIVVSARLNSMPVVPILEKIDKKLFAFRKFQYSQ